ncbi:MAG TPA: MarR family transcriptional regulator [Nitrososphaera sp.]|nr:MarR family transcriptional regulator [Nitrososphaera sp.]
MQVESDPEHNRILLEEEDGNGSAPQASSVSEEVITGRSGQVLVQEKEPLLVVTDLHNNDTKILLALNEESGSNYSFKGLMRKLGLHQQSLSRALRRLEEMGLVEKSQAGYRLARGSESAISKIDFRRPKEREYTQLLQTYIPLNVRASEIVSQLMGRWFKNLRWLGMIESEAGYTLQWFSEDGSFQINLRMISNYIVIETNASTEREKVEAMVGSYAIYEQITKAVQSKIEVFTDRSLALSHNN